MKKRAFIYIIIACSLWGTSSIFVHLVSPFGFSSLQMTFVRAIVATAFMTTLLLVTDKSLFKVKKEELPFFAGSGMSFFLTATFYFMSMQKTSVSTAVVLMYIAPVLVMIYSVAFLGEKLNALKVISVLAMLLGCCLVSGIIGGIKFDLVGIIIGVLSGITYAAYNIITKIQMKKGSNPKTATLYCFLIALLVAIFTCDVPSMPALISQNPPVIILLLLGLGVCTCVLPYLFYTMALKELPAGTVSALGILEPMAATVFSILFLNEHLTVTSAMGIVLILSAVFLLGKSQE